MSRLPVHRIGTSAQELDLGNAKVYHLPNWHSLSHPQRLGVMRQIATMRGRDPRLAKLAVSICRKSARPRQFDKQAAALLKWVQNPKNVYYMNEPGERLQDPIYTIKVKHGDCFAEDTLVLRDDMEMIPIQNVRVGDRIWGKDRWSEVVNTWEKGKLPVTEVCLNNGSVLRLTEEHKVYVQSCCGPKKGERHPACKNPSRKDHGPLCSASAGGWKQCVARYGSEEVRLKVSELREGMQVLQPEKIEQPGTTRWIDSEGAWLLGAFVAEGWAEESRAMISGKDGHWKEATKTRAKAYAERRGWAVRWHEKYIALNSSEAAAFVGECGKGALNKRIPKMALAEGCLTSLDDGLKLDASQNSRGEGWTFGTISPALAVQYRVLQRMLGRSTSMKMVTNHGGYGKNPIYRVGVRSPSGNQDRRLLVRAIHREVEEVPCYDIATDDHYVYLPEADCTVSNCDDQVLLLCSLFEAVRLPWRLVLSGRNSMGEKLRYIEGAAVPGGCTWSHVYCMVGTPPFRPNRWYFCETTVEGVPLGWDVISGDHAYLPEMMKKPKGPSQVISAPPAPYNHRPKRAPSNPSPAYQESMGQVSAAVGASIAEEMEGAKGGTGLQWGKIAGAVATGVAVSVLTQVALDWVRGKGTFEGSAPLPVRMKGAIVPLQDSAFIYKSKS